MTCSISFLISDIQCFNLCFDNCFCQRLIDGKSFWQNVQKQSKLCKTFMLIWFQLPDKPASSNICYLKCIVRGPEIHFIYLSTKLLFCGPQKSNFVFLKIAAFSYSSFTNFLMKLSVNKPYLSQHCLLLIVLLRKGYFIIFLNCWNSVHDLGSTVHFVIFMTIFPHFLTTTLKVDLRYKDKYL